MAVVSPRRVRQYAEAMGKLAKTDRIDAKVIAEFASATKPLPKTREETRLDQLCRVHRVRMRQKIQLMQAEEYETFEELEGVKTVVGKQLQQVEKEMEKLVQGSEKGKLLMTAPGVGAKTAAVLLAQLPELGEG